MFVTRDQLRPYISDTLTEDRVAALIETYVDPAPSGFSISQARLRQAGASVAAVIADLDALDGNVEKTANDFDATLDEIIAAVFFYWKHQNVIDAEITVRRSAFME